MGMGDHLDLVGYDHDYDRCGWCNGKTEIYGERNLSIPIGFLTIIGCVILWAVLFG